MTGNLVYQKFVSLSFFDFYTFELSAGSVFYPLTFLITDLITEFYNKQRASFCVKLAIIMNITIVFIVSVLDNLQATSWSKVNNYSFHHVFGSYSIAFIGSVLACYCAQYIDIEVYSGIRRLTGERKLWLRNFGSTSLSLFADTSIVIGFMTIFGILPWEHLQSLIIKTYSFKIFFTVCTIPLFYITVALIKHMMAREETSSLNKPGVK